MESMLTNTPCDGCKSCGLGKDCEKWYAWFCKVWAELQRKAGINVDGKADQSVA